eukprot:3561209-Rhodomonas_salina.1
MEPVAEERAPTRALAAGRRLSSTEVRVKGRVEQRWEGVSSRSVCIKASVAQRCHVHGVCDVCVSC